MSKNYLWLVAVFGMGCLADAGDYGEDVALQSSALVQSKDAAAQAQTAPDPTATKTVTIQMPPATLEVVKDEPAPPTYGLCPTDGDSPHSITAGFAHTCAIRRGGQVACWGRGENGQLGNGARTTSSAPVFVSGLTDARRISSHSSHTCATRGTGQVACWGSGYYGQLGNRSYADATTPVTVSDLTGVMSVAAGGAHTCAIVGGSVKCWGLGLSGQLGNGRFDNALSPVTVVGITDAVSISAGDYHTCVARGNGQISCWGENFRGQLGNGTRINSNVPVTSNVPRATAGGWSSLYTLDAGNFHTCATFESRTQCWGYDGTGFLDSSIPVTLPGLSSSQIATGHTNTCAVRTGLLQVACWGTGSSGQLGGGTLNGSSSPVNVPGLDDVTQIAVGGAHTCAVRSTTGRIVCWGDGRGGQLGNGVQASSSSPVTVLDCAK